VLRRFTWVTDSGLSIFHVDSSCSGTVDKPIYLHNIIHVLAITKNLLSISQLLHDDDVIVEFTLTHCFVKDRSTRQVLLHEKLLNGLYQLDLALSKHLALQATHFSAFFWHARLTHCSPAITTTLSATQVFHFVLIVVLLRHINCLFFSFYFHSYCSSIGHPH
jgi:hypothetical protein